MSDTTTPPRAAVDGMKLIHDIAVLIQRAGSDENRPDVVTLAEHQQVLIRAMWPDITPPAEG